MAEFWIFNVEQLLRNPIIYLSNLLIQCRVIALSYVYFPDHTLYRPRYIIAPCFYTRHVMRRRYRLGKLPSPAQYTIVASRYPSCRASDKDGYPAVI